MPQCHLLLGAGFSKNWGGPLASEAFGYLLDTPELRDQPQLRSLLWDHRKGGFEAALSVLQQRVKVEPGESNDQGLSLMQEAIRRMFREIDAAFAKESNFSFNNSKKYQVITFLAHFDMIFSLNQDLLLERHYLIHDGTGLDTSRGRRIPMMPGVRRENFLEVCPAGEPPPTIRVGSNPSPLRSHQQPVFKLHGSSNWITAEGDGLLVIGSGKSEFIASHPLLSAYQEQFRRSLLAPNARLMVIGYGFRDVHVNEAIRAGVGSQLKLFIVDPNGAEVLRGDSSLGDAGGIEANPGAFIGESRQSLDKTFKPDLFEHAKLMRFFEC